MPASTGSAAPAGPPPPALTLRESRLPRSMLTEIASNGDLANYGPRSSSSAGNSSGASTARRMRQMSAAEQNHLARLQAAREGELALLRTGGLAAARALAEKQRASIIAQVDSQARRERARRQVEIASTYGGRVAAVVAGVASPTSASASSPGSPAAAARARSGATSLQLTKTLLGEGATSKVYLGRFGPTRSEVAAKVVRKSEMSAEELGWIREEIAIHKRLRHAHICTLHGALETPAVPGCDRSHMHAVPHACACSGPMHVHAHRHTLVPCSTSL